MPNIGPAELILILVIALIFIGPGKLPEVGASIGKSLREFRKASSDVQEATNVDVSVAPIPPTPAPVAPVAPVATPPVTTTPGVPDAAAIAAAQATLAAAGLAMAAAPAAEPIVAAAPTPPEVEPPLFADPSESGPTSN